ncbi:hypothetical protein Dsin_023833 [Dipteronia sinensis]|uniref:Disease resistance protein At4g27190-like leucine-rich repeats domain-containing protein n=1 Tax=Dipteronia sinensis TaxID=43782 RepID=A0AAE0A4E1_9ROSI|nr:hypothetical protein Dsin_023833 [Dipteronia sinensis]
MEEIFIINRREEDINNDEGTDQIEFKYLSSLILISLPKLTSFCSINNNKDMFDTPTLLFNQKVAFPSLEIIEISKMDGLEMIWPNQLCNDSFCNLKSLEVTECNKLLTIFQSNMLERVTRLEYLTICDCDLVEEIFDLQGLDFEESCSEVESRLRKLVINGLPKLKHIWNKDPQKMFSFQKLDKVKVHHCMSLKYLFPVSIAESLSELEQLDVYYCGVEEFVVDDQGEANVAATFVFPRITSLDLKYLPRLKTFYRGVHTSQWQNLKGLTICDCDTVTFPSLEEIKISKSNNLKILWQKGAKESFCNLKSMKVSDCNKLLTICQFNTLEGLSMPKLLTVTISKCASVEEIFDLQKVNFEESHSRPVMNPLQKLYLLVLPKLKHIWKKDPQAKLSFEELPMPKSLIVSDCASVEEIFDLQKVNFEESHSRAVINHQLQQLNINWLPKLKHIWNKDPQAELSFENLQKVDVSNCESLKNLFPASIARNLSQLVELNVDSCGKLEDIVAKEREAKEAARFVFPKVTSITLDTLPELRTFYRGVHSSKWEVLKELKVVGCDKIKLLASQLSCFQENNIEESYIDISVQPSFFLVEKDSFPILEKLKLIGEATRMISQGQFSEELFCNLKFLRVKNDKSVLFPLRILQRFRHLHVLHLKSSSYKEIFSYEEDGTHVGVDSKLDMIISKLEKLTVADCQNLIQLVPSSTSFQNLTVLKVWGCHGLKNLMTSSTAKRLVQLREMEIAFCKSMIEVVAKGGDVTEDKIIFSKLRTLTLDNLPSLSCFCSENYTFELPSLEEIDVSICPEMKYFSLGDITTRILQKVRRDFEDCTLEGGLNTTIQKTVNWCQSNHLRNIWSKQGF